MTIGEQQDLAETRRREVARTARRELRREAGMWALFAGLVVALWLVSPPHSVAWGQSALCIAITALAMAVQFQWTLGYTASTQLALVPLAFAVPAALLPLAVLTAFVLHRLPRIIRGELPAAKLMYAASNSFFALGPAWVYALMGPARHDGVFVLLAAFGGQLVADFISAGFYFRFGRGASLRSQLTDMSSAWAIDGALWAISLVVALQTRHSSWAVLAIVPLLALFAMFARERTGRLDKLLELNDTYRGTALLLGDVVEADDAYTGMHSQGVVELALAVGQRLRLDADRVRNLEFAALLHDVGKIAIPKEIINKPGKLDAEEWELVKTHSVEGERMLARVGGFMADVGTIVRSHHERWDGGGYPDGLVGEAAPLEARIITACDSWSAMRTDRPYRSAMAHEAAVAEVVRHRGTQFDPRVADALLTVVERTGEDRDAGRGSATLELAALAG